MSNADDRTHEEQLAEVDAMIREQESPVRVEGEG